MFSFDLEIIGTCNEWVKDELYTELFLNMHAVLCYFQFLAYELHAHATRIIVCENKLQMYFR